MIKQKNWYHLFNSVLTVGLIMQTQKKLVFRLLEIFLDIQKICLSSIERILDHFLRSQNKNWCNILKAVLKVGLIMWTMNKKKIKLNTKQPENYYTITKKNTFCLGKKYNCKSILYYRLLKLIWVCGISFSARTFKRGQKCVGCWTIKKFGPPV